MIEIGPNLSYRDNRLASNSNSSKQKICIICGASYKRGTGISDKVWEKRRCCCRNCSNYLRRKETTMDKNKKRRIDTEKGVKTTYAMQ